MNSAASSSGDLPGLEASAKVSPLAAMPVAAARPRVKPVDRSQLTWQMLDVERLIEPEHPARAIWELVGRVKLEGFYAPIEAVEGTAGRTPWDPRLLVSLWIYAYSRGISSAREIARRCTYEPAFQWLCGLGEINHHTLSDFRVDHDVSLRELFVQVLGVLSSEGLVSLERVMHDGTRIKACAGSDSFRREERLKEHLAAARQQVEAMGDPREEEPARKGAARRRAVRERQARLEQALEELEQIRAGKRADKEQARASQSDPQARDDETIRWRLRSQLQRAVVHGGLAPHHCGSRGEPERQRLRSSPWSGGPSGAEPGKQAGPSCGRRWIYFAGEHYGDGGAGSGYDWFVTRGQSELGGPTAATWA